MSTPKMFKEYRMYIDSSRPHLQSWKLDYLMCSAYKYAQSDNNSRSSYSNFLLVEKKIEINRKQVQIHALQNQAYYSNYLRIIFNTNDPSYLDRLTIKIHEHTSWNYKNRLLIYCSFIWYYEFVQSISYKLKMKLTHYTLKPILDHCST